MLVACQSRLVKHSDSTKYPKLKHSQYQKICFITYTQVWFASRDRTRRTERLRKIVADSSSISERIYIILQRKSWLPLITFIFRL
jgi:hypothetical protein